MLGTTAGYQQSYSELCDLGGKKWVTSQFLFEESGKGIIICYTYHCLLWRPYEIISSEVFGNLSLHYVNTQTFTYLVIYVSLCFYFSSGFLPLLAYVIFKHIPDSCMWLLFCVSFQYLFSCFHLPTSSSCDSTYSLIYLVSYFSTPIQSSKCIEASITWETPKPTPTCCTWQPGLWSMLLPNNLGRFLETLTGPPYLGLTALYALVSHELIIIEQSMASHSLYSWYL